MVKPDGAAKTVRRGKGEKANKKKMATVAAVYNQEPCVRTPKQVLDSLFRSHDALPSPNRPKPPVAKRVWASLIADKDRFIADVKAEMTRRDPRHRRTWVMVTDGERALQRRVATKRGLKGHKAKTIGDVANYYYRNRQRMRYDVYLANGWPIASGSVEGACKNLVRDRFERSGMRWTPETAEALLRMRAMHLSGEFDAYWQFHVKQEQQRLHRESQWRVVAR